MNNNSLSKCNKPRSVVRKTRRWISVACVCMALLSGCCKTCGPRNTDAQVMSEQVSYELLSVLERVPMYTGETYKELVPTVMYHLEQLIKLSAHVRICNIQNIRAFHDLIRQDPSALPKVYMNLIREVSMVSPRLGHVGGSHGRPWHWGWGWGSSSRY